VAFTTRPGWFLCPYGHDYEKPVHLRIRFGLGCPECKESGIKRVKTKVLKTAELAQHKGKKVAKAKKR
jgi:hypothetical protein